MISRNKQKKLKKIKELEDRLNKIMYKNNGAVSYRITYLFERKIYKIQNSLSKEME